MGHVTPVTYAQFDDVKLLDGYI